MMSDLDAIRARHHPVAGLRDVFCRHCATLWPCDVDALLAEVYRLTRYAAGHGYLNAYGEGQEAERARIRAAVEGLPPFEAVGCWHISGEMNEPIAGAVDRAAVLAAIDGEDPK